MSNSHPTPIVTIRGRLTAWRFASEDGWGYGQVDEHSVVGKLVGARVGDDVELTGDWQTHPKHGRQFRLRTCTAALPQTRDGVIAWLVSTLPNVGQARAEALYDAFGHRLWDVIEHASHELTTVPGITLDRAAKLFEAYERARDDRDSMVALRGWGLTDSQIKQCLLEWGQLTRVVDRIRANPYALAHSVHGFGFERADQVAAKVGVPRDAPERVAAAVEHVLGQALSAGHCYVAGAMLQRELVKLLGCTAAQAARGIRDALVTKRVVASDWRIYPAAIAAAEQRAANRIRKLLRTTAQ